MQKTDPSLSRKRRRLGVVFGLIGLVGFGGGALANRGVARLLALPADKELPEYTDVTRPVAGAESDEDGGDEASAGASASPSSRSRAQPKRAYGEIIVRRNIFDSSAVYNPESAVAMGNGDCKSDASVRLLATMVVEPPEYSSALISTGSSREAKADGYGLGDSVGSEGRITLIDQKRVCLDGGTCICIGTDAVAKIDTKAAGDSGTDGVEKVSDTKFLVDASVLEDALGNVETLAGQIRVVPHKDASGNIDGYRLSAIRKKSLFDKLGIKNGDVVHAVNGTPLTSTEGALATYQTLKNERAFNFEITRRNEKRTMEYEVR